jgi:hypothetical protein
MKLKPLAASSPVSNSFLAVAVCLALSLAGPGKLSAYPAAFFVAAQDQRTTSLHLATPDLEIEALGTGGFSKLLLPEAEFTAQQGAPELPYFSTLVAIPPKGGFSVSVSHPRAVSYGLVKPVPADSTGRGDVLAACDQRVYESADPYPHSVYMYGEPEVIRDFRVIRLNLFPVQYTGASGELTVIRSFDVTITMNDSPGGNELPGYDSYSSAFTSLYQSMICNFAFYRDVMVASPGARILLLHGANSDPIFLGQLAEFVAWKRQKGFEVNVASTAQTGSSNLELKAYIQTQYDNVNTRPDYIILMGDTAGSYALPVFYYNLAEGIVYEGDYPYTHLAGNDFLGDAFIGRISAEDLSQLIVILAKVYALEKNINVQNAGWLNRILLIGDPANGTGVSAYYVNQFVKELSLRYNPDYSFVENYSSGIPATINQAINQGVAFFNYRGYIGMSGWSPSSSLVNGPRLPHATILTCATGNYAGCTSTTEAFIRLGTASAPAGAVTAVGIASSSTNTLFNNALTTGMYDGIFTYGMRTMGEAVLNARLYIKQVYSGSHDNHANTFAHWCNLMGDPTAEIFIGIPDQFSISCPSTLPVGSNILDLSVTDSQGVSVEGACVTAFSQTLQTVLARSWTDDQGAATLNFASSLGNDVLTITASLHGFKPSQQTVTADPSGSLVFHTKSIYDNGTHGSIGNGDTFANGGETIAMQVALKNTSSAAITSISALLTSDDPYVEILQAASAYPDLAPNASSLSQAYFTFSVSANAPHYHNIRFQLEIQSGNDGYTVVFYQAAYNARLSVQSYLVLSGDDSYPDPAEEGYITITVKNSSIASVTDLSGALYSLNDMIAVTDSVSYIGTVPASGMAMTADGYMFQVRSEAIPGMQIPMRLRLFNSNGFEQFALFNVLIGQVSQTDPLGPDAYGYMIYDSSDTSYPDCPTYQWLEINPALGGPGTEITGYLDAGLASDEGDQVGSIVLEQVELPFPFRFYGLDYTQVSVCSNGFVALGTTLNGEFRNYPLPGGYGPSPLIAPFWDDLCFQVGAGIFKYYDPDGHTFTIEYYQMLNGYDRVSQETFQVVFYDPQFHPTSMGDGKIKFQYQDFNNVDAGNAAIAEPTHGNFCTVGFKDHTNTRGLQYTFNNQYPPAALPIVDGTALLITTQPVVYVNAYLVLQSVYPGDTNGNGLAEPGETLELGFELQNLGINAATGIHLTASEHSDWATLGNPASLYQDIPGYQSGYNNDPIVVHIDPDTPDGVAIPVALHVNTFGRIWEFVHEIVVHRPAISVNSYYLNDSAGDGDGLIDPGEAVKLIINYENRSGLAANGVTTSLSSLGSLATVLTSDLSIPRILPGETCQAVYQLAISPSAPEGGLLPFSVAFSANLFDGDDFDFDLGVAVSGLNTNFEFNDGGFSSIPSEGAWIWGTSHNMGAHSGTKVWGTRLDQQYPPSSVWFMETPQVHLGAGVFLQFWHRYNTEAGYDGGNVSISTNGGSSWTIINPVGGYPSNPISLGAAGWSGNSGGWVPARFNLSIYANLTVMFRFSFCSDFTVNADGWFIDDVQTTGYAGFAGYASGQISSSDAQMDFSSVSVSNHINLATYAGPGGNYILYIPEGDTSLLASSPGYQSPAPASISISVADPVENVDFYLGYFAPPANLAYTVADSEFVLTWSPPAQPEYEIIGYGVYCRENSGPFVLVSEPVNAQHIQDIGLLGTAYVFQVVTRYSGGNSLPSEQLSYTVTPVDDDVVPLPPTGLAGNYPNPFNPETTIRFYLREQGPVRLSIFNVRGQLVGKLVDSALPGGTHSAVWNGRDATGRPVASGVYFCRLEAAGHEFVRKMLLLK